jgi:hypothetical protein
MVMIKSLCRTKLHVLRYNTEGNLLWCVQDRLNEKCSLLRFAFVNETDHLSKISSMCTLSTTGNRELNEKGMEGESCSSDEPETSEVLCNDQKSWSSISH